MSHLVLLPIRPTSFEVKDCKLRPNKVHYNLRSKVDPLTVFDIPKNPFLVNSLNGASSAGNSHAIVIGLPLTVISAT